MLDMLLDPLTGDLDLSGNTLVLTGDRVTVVSQRLDGALSLWLGDWFENLEAGVDWDSLLDQKQTAPILRTVTAVIESDPDVATSSLAIERTGRSVLVSGTALLGTGEIVPINATVGPSA